MASRSTQDPYKLLGISRQATQDDIKKAYRKLALKWHPDKNPQNKDQAEKKFKEITAAYEILSDSQKRAIFDRYGMEGFKQHAGNGSGQNPNAAYFHTFNTRGPSGFMFRDPFQVFEEMFGSSNPFDFDDIFSGGLSDFGFIFGGSRGRRPTRRTSSENSSDADLQEAIHKSYQDMYNTRPQRPQGFQGGFGGLLGSMLQGIGVRLSSSGPTVGVQSQQMSTKNVNGHVVTEIRTQAANGEVTEVVMRDNVVVSKKVNGRNVLLDNRSQNSNNNRELPEQANRSRTQGRKTNVRQRNY